MTKSKLVDACIDKFGGKIFLFKESSNEELIHCLAMYQSSPASAAPQSNKAHSNLPGDNSALASNSLLPQIIKSFFLSQLSAKGKEYCKMGHDLELPFVKQLF
jgi:hypothetical protein